MTYDEKCKIDTLRNEGCGCTAIAAALGLSLNSVKSYCRRTKPQAVKPVTIEITEGGCEYCGAELVHIEGKKRKRFCSDKCRMSWWNHHRIIGNEKMRGNVLHQTSYVNSYLSKKQCKNKGELPMYLHIGTHEGIVSDEVFEKAKAERERRSKAGGLYDYDGLAFRKKIRCPCGMNFMHT